MCWHAEPRRSRVTVDLVDVRELEDIVAVGAATQAQVQQLIEVARQRDFVLSACRRGDRELLVQVVRHEIPYFLLGYVSPETSIGKRDIEAVAEGGSRAGDDRCEGPRDAHKRSSSIIFEYLN